MARIAYVNGRYVPKSDATVHVEDRGNQFADGVYEVLKVVGGRLSDGDRHFARLHRSLDAVRIAPPMSDAALAQVIRETVRRNRLTDATVYLQISRGPAPRDHLFPAVPHPTLIVTAKRMKRPDPAGYADGVAVVTAPDIRWLKCEIKSISLLPNVLAKQAADEQGAYEAWLLREGDVVTEASASNAFIVDAQGVLRTHPLSPVILGGVTRSVVLDLARAEGVPVAERAFTTAEIAAAREAFLTSTSSWVMPVVRVDGGVVGEGVPGPVTRRLQQAYHRHVFGNREAAPSNVAAHAAAG
ncbi:MAG: D-amino-acid transaminase [Alphaproteobacteria bacterium]|jgi:D-alanine transaminase|nr:D-amino-acid transaminase [Alphaproteobacteria bacterium]